MVGMSEEAAHIAREAHGLQQGLKKLLETKEPGDKEVEFQRRSLRREYLRLLFKHPYATESRDVENHLWMATSYQFISRYKDRISKLDRAIYGSPHQQQQAPRQTAGQNRVTEHRKLLQRFRQFLSDEEKFWLSLIGRLRRFFALDDAQRALAALSIDEGPTAPSDLAPTEGATSRRSQHQFPAEADGVLPEAASATAVQRQSKMAVLSKALVHLGDLERYKEQYNEAGGRPRAGHEDGPPAAASQGRGGRGRRGGSGAAGAGSAPAVASRMRNYDKAAQCYEQARLLLPHEGNPSHGLAILALYQKDTFTALVQYYRALCVRTPYDAAAGNMQMTLSRALDAWRHASKEKEKEEANGTTPMIPRLRVGSFKEKLIVLHALLQSQPKGDEETSRLTAILEKATAEFKGLVADRVIPPDMIWKVVIMAQGALWRHRSTRHSSSGSRSSSHKAPLAASAIESHIATHLLSLHRVLLEVGIVELAEAPEDAAEHDLAQNITATFRRTLPALRLASKWMRANLKYIIQAEAQPGANGGPLNSLDRSQSMETRRDRGGRSSGSTVSIIGLREFWSTYAQFSSALLRTFPLEKLPILGVALEEDVELAGFLPLKLFASGEVRTGSSERAAADQGEMSSREEVHPNVEQLMRIYDLLTDAQAVASVEGTPVILNEDRFVLTLSESDKLVVLQPVLDGASAQVGGVKHTSTNEQRATESFVGRVDSPDYAMAEIEDDAMTETTRTDDDPVNDAFRKVLDRPESEEEEEQEDEIVWNPSASPRNTGQPPALQTSPGRLNPPMSFVPTLSPRGMAPNLPSALPTALDRTPSMASKPLVTTAEDLLKGLQRPNGHHRVPSAPQPQLLFGSPTSGTLGSIWSTAHDGDAFRFPKTAAGTSTPSHYPSQSSYNFSQGSYASQRTSSHMLDAAVPARIIQQPSLSMNGHQRTPSQTLPMGRSQGLPSPNSSQLYGYTTYLPTTESASHTYSTGVPSAYADPVYSTGPTPALHQQYPPGYPLRSVHHSRFPSAGQGNPGLQAPMASLSSMSQLWPNPG